MSTLKTVLSTTAVLALGAVITLGWNIAVFQQDRIDSLQTQVSDLQSQIVDVQNQTDENKVRLDHTIKTANKNFSAVSKRQTQLRDAILVLADILKQIGSDPTPAPTNFTRSSNQPKYLSITPDTGTVN